MKTAAFVNPRSSASLAATAIVLALLAIAMETVLDVPLKLPGHRALPGAMALLVFAEAFAPILLIAFAGVVSAALVLQGTASAPLVAVWIAAALGIAAMGRTRLAHGAAYFLLGGLLFGLLRCLSASFGWHHTPDLVRYGGHAAFGALGGLAAYGLSRVLSPPEARKERRG